MEQNLEDKISKLETENRNLKERVDREINEKYAIKSELSKADDMNKQLLKIIENLSSGIGNR